MHCNVPELFGSGDHMDLLVQDLLGFILVNTVLDHCEEELRPHCALLLVFRDVR